MTSCTECHGNRLEGWPFLGTPNLAIASAYSDADLIRLMREGKEMSVIAYGSSVPLAVQAAEELDEDIEVIDLRTLQPLDEDAVLASARKTGKVLVAHEATRSCGAGAEVAALVSERAFEDLDAPVRRLTTPDVPIPFSPPLEQHVLPQLDDMKEACRELIAY